MGHRTEIILCKEWPSGRRETMAYFCCYESGRDMPAIAIRMIARVLAGEDYNEMRPESEFAPVRCDLDIEDARRVTDFAWNVLEAFNGACVVHAKMDRHGEFEARMGWIMGCDDIAGTLSGPYFAPDDDRFRNYVPTSFFFENCDGCEDLEGDYENHYIEAMKILGIREM